MKATKKLLTLAGLAAFALAAQAVPTVSLKSVRQRYPWNNTVDIVYTVTGYDAVNDVDSYFVTFDATIPGIADDIECTAGKMIDGNGDFTVAWDATRDSVIYTDSAKLTMKVYNLQNQIKVDSLADADYEVWDLTTSPFTVSYEKVPVLNDVKLQRISNARYSDAEFKTSKLVLRLVKESDTVYAFCKTKTPGVYVDQTYAIGIYELTQGQIATILQTLGVDIAKHNYGGITYNNPASVHPAYNLTFSALFGGSHQKRDTTAITAAWADAASNSASADATRSGDGTESKSLLSLMNANLPEGLPEGAHFNLPTETQ